MPRYIDADALISKLAYHRDGLDHNNVTAVSVLNNVIEVIERRPTVSPDEVRGVGKWEDAKQHGLCRCSVCKDCYIEKDYITQAKWRFCPSCGARLRTGGANDS